MRLSGLESRVAQLETKLAQRRPMPVMIFTPPLRALENCPGGVLTCNGRQYSRLAGESPQEFVARIEAGCQPSFTGVGIIDFLPATFGPSA